MHHPRRPEPPAGAGPGTATHRENGLFDVGIPLVLPERGPGERACEAHAGHCQMGGALLFGLGHLGGRVQAVEPRATTLPPLRVDAGTVRPRTAALQSPPSAL